jgi:hypothetical protein
MDTIICPAQWLPSHMFSVEWYRQDWKESRFLLVAMLNTRCNFHDNGRLLAKCGRLLDINQMAFLVQKATVMR